ncbi:MAG: cob(I)yrinic acid a,c-diamide adenosyltransferase [Muribaculaceae bacterium]|nr:cob(I)yrinic acid a,c-diamide adenosyltransferase [Muribaculaceae bacterium]
MKRIYTRSGDKGTTAIHGGERVAKTDIRIETNGTLDELNVAVGNVRTSLPSDHLWQSYLREIQLNLMVIMSLVATHSAKRHNNPNSLPDDLVEDVERLIDTITSQCTPPDSFILPGGTPLASLLHQARVIARRAERRLWSLNMEDPVEEMILQYINRLSDLFFIMARYELQHSGCGEEVWREFGYKRRIR